MGKINAVSTADEQEIAEARGFTLPDMLYDVVARAATSSIGQFVYKRIDNLLWTVEKTARWSLPQQPAMVSEKKATSDTAAVGTEESEDVGTNISGPPLVRPLPWLLFLPALIVLRLIRTVLSMGARFIGRGPVLPATMVGFLQNKRRKLRALKYRGQRLQRISRNEMASDGEPPQGAAATWLQRIILPLKMVICTGPNRATDVNSDVAHAVVFRKDRPTVATHKRSATVSKKRNLNQREAESAEEQEASDEDSFEDAGCKELLEKYANVAGDSSFNVEDISSASDDSSSSQSDADPSPKKPNLETSKQLNGNEQQQPTQPAPKTVTLKRSASEHKNGIDVPQPASKGSIGAKSINAANRSKSAAELEKANNTQPAETSGADGNSSTTTPSKSIPNLPSSPENNENKPINHNISGAAAIPIKSPSPAVLKPLAKQSPTMSDVRNSFQQQKQAAATKPPPAAQQQQLQQQQQTQQQQHISNGGKNRNKKPSTQSAA